MTVHFCLLSKRLLLFTLYGDHTKLLLPLGEKNFHLHAITFIFSCLLKSPQLGNLVHISTAYYMTFEKGINLCAMYQIHNSPSKSSASCYCMKILQNVCPFHIKTFSRSITNSLLWVNIDGWSKGKFCLFYPSLYFYFWQCSNPEWHWPQNWTLTGFYGK